MKLQRFISFSFLILTFLAISEGNLHLAFHEDHHPHEHAEICDGHHHENDSTSICEHEHLCELCVLLQGSQTYLPESDRQNSPYFEIGGILNEQFATFSSKRLEVACPRGPPAA